MAKIVTKKKEVLDGAPCWRVYVNGRRTKLYIEKARERPRWGHSQSYDLHHDDTGFLTESGVFELLLLIERIGLSFTGADQ